MLPAANRLRTAADFTTTTRSGTKVSRGCVVVYLKHSVDLTTSDLAPPRAGLVVSKQVGGSVERHRAARRIRAALRPLLTDLPAGSRVVVRALPGADRAPTLAADLATALTSAAGRLR